jgi:hypothetical protein
MQNYFSQNFLKSLNKTGENFAKISIGRALKVVFVILYGNNIINQYKILFIDLLKIFMPINLILSMIDLSMKQFIFLISLKKTY